MPSTGVILRHHVRLLVCATNFVWSLHSDPAAQGASDYEITTATDTDTVEKVRASTQRSQPLGPRDLGVSAVIALVRQSESGRRVALGAATVKSYLRNVPRRLGTHPGKSRWPPPWQSGPRCRCVARPRHGADVRPAARRSGSGRGSFSLETENTAANSPSK